MGIVSDLRERIKIEERLQQARQTLGRFYSDLGEDGVYSGSPYALPPGTSPPGDVLRALTDDLNAPLAITRLHAYANAIRHAPNEKERVGARRALVAGARLMGLLEGSWADLLSPPVDVSEIFRIEECVAQRTLARKERRFADADRIRDELAEEGILLEDGPTGTTWRRG